MPTPPFYHGYNYTISTHILSIKQCFSEHSAIHVICFYTKDVFRFQAIARLQELSHARKSLTSATGYDINPKVSLSWPLSYIKSKVEAKITSHAPLSLRNVQTAEQTTNQNMDFFPRRYLLLELSKHFIHSTYRESFAFNVNQHGCQLKVHNLETKIKSWRERNSRSPCLYRLTSMSRTRVRLTRSPWVLQARLRGKWARNISQPQ